MSAVASPLTDPYLPSPLAAYPFFFEAANDERECGDVLGCPTVATTVIWWKSGERSVACDQHATMSRVRHERFIARMSTWVPED